MSSEQDSQRATRPSGALKFFFDLPGLFYRLGLGWILGKRFLALTHRGRKSGKPHQTILEVVHFDKVTMESIVASAYGTSADWFRNLEAGPALRVRTGRLDYVPEHRILSQDEAQEAAVRFARDHPWEARMAPRVLPAIGAHVPEGSDLEPAALMATLPMVALRPRAE